MMNLHEDIASENLRRIRCLGLKATYLCNNRCSFCWQPHHGKKSDISAKALENLKPLLALGNLKVIQPAGGEIFLWKPLKEFLGFIEKHNQGVQMYLVTNGTLFDPYWYAKAEAGFFSVVSFSINAPNRDLYKSICNRDNFDVVKKALNTLGDIKKRIPFAVQISFVMTKPLMGMLAEFVDLAEGNADVLLARELRPARNYKQNVEYFSNNYIPPRLVKSELVAEFAQTAELCASRGILFDYSQYSLELNSKPIFSSTQCPSYEFSEERCGHLYNQLQVEETGDVRLGCNFSGVKIGNLNKSNIGEIMSNPIIERIREEAVEKGNYLACPPKLASFACPYFQRQISEKTGIDRYIAELPEFAFPRDSWVAVSRARQNDYRAVMKFLTEMLKSSFSNTAEAGFGALTPLLVAYSGNHRLENEPEADFSEALEEYFKTHGISWHNKSAENPERFTRGDPLYDVVVLNSNAGSGDVLHLLKEVHAGGYLFADTGVFCSGTGRELLNDIASSGEWALYKQFGLMILIFRKTEKKDKPRRLPYELIKAFKAVDTLKELKEKGIEKVALFGAGKHTQWLWWHWRFFGAKGPSVTAVLDDFPDGKETFFNRQVVNAANFTPSSVDAIILSTDVKQDIFAMRCTELYGDSVKLIDIYGGNHL